MKKITCIIPAFNEEKQIAAVLEVALEAKQKIPMEIIVVDDGSSDSTPAILKQYKNIQVLTNKPNKGKSYSIAKALKIANGDYIFLLDADLHGLKVENIFALLKPIQDGVSEITMTVRKNAPNENIYKHKMDHITGERIFPQSLVDDHINDIRNLPNFALEVFLNDLIIKQGCSIKVVHWDNVLNKNKAFKRGFVAGWKANFKAVHDVLQVMTLREYIRQYFAMRKLLVK
jgi:glycosyltransferase involved in cell wall biosynthesis